MKDKPDSSLKIVSASSFSYTGSYHDYHRQDPVEYSAVGHTFVFSDGSVWNMFPSEEKKWKKIFPEN